ncbi:MAG: ribosomal subunit interface protein [Chitinophagaceae bacterium]|nr:MAG: ribosomal subunit interface protein [Chitinophagaceae bacterium]
MEIKVHTDNHITSTNEFIEKYVTALQKNLTHYSEYITFGNIFFADENKGKSGIADKRCTIEIHVKNMNPEAVTHYADTISHAFNGATDKLWNLLDHKIGKKQNKY